MLPKKQQAGALTPPAVEPPASAAKPAAKGAAKGAQPAATKAKAAAKAQQPAKPKPAPVVAENGLPMQIATALQRYDVVVVSLWGSGGKVDVMARDEAQAGAAAARAAFVSLNVIESQRAAEALTLKLDQVLSTPTVLVYKSPDELVNVLGGFRDRETVAQAAINALR